MPVLRNLDRKLPTTLGGRVRNYLADRTLGATQCMIHENVVNPAGVVPWHRHPVEEVIVVLDGQGEYETDGGVEAYGAGDVIIIPPGTNHRLANVGTVPIRQLCFFAGDAATQWAPSTEPEERPPDGT